jgi:Fic family protein
MARCLQSLVLARGKVLAPLFMSIEEYLGRNTQKYYEILSEVGRGSWRPGNDARPWLRFILTAHLRQARTMLVRIRESERLWVDLEKLIEQQRLPERVMSPMFDAAMGLRVRNVTYRAALEESGEESITEQTAQRDFQRLVEAKLLIPSGQRRGRFYIASDSVAQIWQQIRSGRDPRNDTDPFAD